MTNEELLERIANGEEAALAKLSLMNTGLVKDRARLIARQYHCLRQTKYGSLSDYAKETLSELESVGKLALVECVRAGGYDAEKGRFTTYVTPVSGRSHAAASGVQHGDACAGSGQYGAGAKGAASLLSGRKRTP